MPQTKLFYARGHEAKLLTMQDKGTFLLLLRPQPPRGHKYAGNGLCGANFFEQKHDSLITIPLHHPSGLYGVKETWAYGTMREVIFKASNKGVMNFDPELRGWRSPVTMPADAIRHHVKFETTVKRVQDVTWKEMKTFVIKSSISDIIKSSCGSSLAYFIDYWNSLHAKPVKKGNGYVCYPHNDSWENGLNLIHHHNKRDGEHYWKNKPLTIHTNPWIKVIAWKRRYK